jgi:hypothetical protein
MEKHDHSMEGLLNVYFIDSIYEPMSVFLLIA